jgi:hypothetical protein
MTEYEGAILQEGNIADDLFTEIGKKNELIVLKHGENPYKVVIGVPHQAKNGVSEICSDPKPRKSDENAASYAIVAYNVLKENGIPCKLVIMAHSTEKDPNKYKDTPYFDEIFKEQAELLFECHGAGPDRRLDIEVSAGRNNLSKTIDFGKSLSHCLENRYSIGIQKEPGKNEALIINTDGSETDGRLQMPANKTVSLVVAGKKGIAALHLEAKPQFRNSEDGKTVSDDGLLLGIAMARAISEYTVSDVEST